MEKLPKKGIINLFISLFFLLDPGFGMEKIRDPGNIPDPQH
jgi:hypothetical protein